MYVHREYWGPFFLGNFKVDILLSAEVPVEEFFSNFKEDNVHKRLR